MFNNNAPREQICLVVASLFLIASKKKTYALQVHNKRFARETQCACWKTIRFPRNTMREKILLIARQNAMARIACCTHGASCMSRCAHMWHTLHVTAHMTRARIAHCACHIAHMAHCAWRTLHVVSICRFVDLSTCRFVNLSICRFADFSNCRLLGHALPHVIYYMSISCKLYPSLIALLGLNSNVN